MVYNTVTALEANYIADLVQQALVEDIGSGDVTAELIAADAQAEATIVTRADMVLCGQAFVNAVFATLDKSIEIQWYYQDGDQILADNTLCQLVGNTRKLLTGERTAINFLQMLSATATTTHDYVEQLKSTKTRLLDTRKTIPLFRKAQKYAVYCGGGLNHRTGLYDAVLIKENHIISCGSLSNAVAQAKKLYPKKVINVEVENLQEFTLALETLADVILLDNFSLAELRAAVKQNKQRKLLEASGTITLENIASVAATGVDYVAIGSLTKNIQAIDLSMRLNG